MDLTLPTASKHQKDPPRKANYISVQADGKLVLNTLELPMADLLGKLISLRTDDPDYFAQMNEVFNAAKEYAPEETPAALAQITTDFERDFNAQGIPTLRAAYRLVAGGL